MGIKNGVKLSGALADWKQKNPLSSMFARIFATIGSVIGGILLILGTLGVIVSISLEGSVSFMLMVGLAVCGIAIDAGSYWIALQIDRNASR